MIIKNLVMALFLLVTMINLLLFLFILGKKIYTLRIKSKRELLQDKYEEKLQDYVTHKENKLSIMLSTKFEKRVFKELLLSNAPFLSGDLKQLLTDKLGREQVINEIKRKLMSKNLWVKKIGTFQAGEIGIGEVSDILLEQLKVKNRELLYVTARAIIKLGGRDNLLHILDEAGKGNRMGKNNVLALVEMIDQDIRDVLENIMLGSSTFLQGMALEIYGKRKYTEGVKWIKIMVSNPSKEIRIASLKGAYALGDIVDEEYFDKILALEKDEAWEVRAFLARFLENVESKEAINILSRLMKDSNWHVRSNAAKALSNHGEIGLKSLVGLLDSRDRFARDKSREEIQKGIIYQDLLLDSNNEADNITLLPNLENVLLKAKENYD